jgi:hypothetical protein
MDTIWALYIALVLFCSFVAADIWMNAEDGW